MSDVVLAVVGSVRFVNPDAFRMAEVEIDDAIGSLHPQLIISGKAHGLDTFAEEFAAARSIPFKGFPPANRRWEPDGFKDRNIRIAGSCTHLLSIRCQAATTYGSGWTADYAEGLDRLVRRRVIPIAGLFVRQLTPGW